MQIPIGTTLADAEREVLLATLRHCGGNKRRTAEMLGVSIKTIYNKLVGDRGGHRRARGLVPAERIDGATPAPPILYSQPTRFPEDRDDQEAQIGPDIDFTR